MFPITRDPTSGSFIQCLAKSTVMVLSCPLTWTQSVLWQHIVTQCVCVYCTVQRGTRQCRTHTQSASLDSAVHTCRVPLQTVRYTHAPRHSLDSAVHGRTTVGVCCHNTDYIHVNRHNRTITLILAKHCIKLPDDGSLVIQNMLEHFKYFKIFYNNSNFIYELYICVSGG